MLFRIQLQLVTVLQPIFTRETDAQVLVMGFLSNICFFHDTDLEKMPGLNFTGKLEKICMGVMSYMN